MSLPLSIICSNVVIALLSHTEGSRILFRCGSIGLPHVGRYEQVTYKRPWPPAKPSRGPHERCHEGTGLQYLKYEVTQGCVGAQNGCLQCNGWVLSGLVEPPSYRNKDGFLIV